MFPFNCYRQRVALVRGQIDESRLWLRITEGTYHLMDAKVVLSHVFENRYIFARHHLVQYELNKMSTSVVEATKLCIYSRGLRFSMSSLLYAFTRGLLFIEKVVTRRC